MPTTVAMHIALTHQLSISNSHRLRMFCDALYSVSFRSIRCVKSKEPSAFLVLLDVWANATSMWGIGAFEG
jgi:hypothetical protein